MSGTYHPGDRGVPVRGDVLTGRIYDDRSRGSLDDGMVVRVSAPLRSTKKRSTMELCSNSRFRGNRFMVAGLLDQIPAAPRRHLFLHALSFQTT